MSSPSEPIKRGGPSSPGHAARWRTPLRLAIIVLTIAVVLWITGCMERYFYYPTAGPTAIPRHFRGAEDVWFTSADGTRLHGWFIPAHRRDRDDDDDDPTAPPTILHVHGNAGNVTSHIWFTEYLPPAGFNVFIFDYRGYGQSEGRAISRGPLIADTHAALDAMLARSDVDPQRIGLYGQSLGGTIALNVMAERAEIKAAVIESPFISWREMAACAIGGETPNALCRSLAMLMIPDTHRADVAIATIHRAVLLLHGTADSIIPVSHSRRLVDASGGRAQLVEFPGGDHNSLRDTHPHVDGVVIDFLREHLK